jgi:O-antigen/teichoic acid export membrane protein
MIGCLGFMDKIKYFLFKNNSVRQTIVKNTFWVATGTTLTKIIRVIVIIYAARLLGAENYGIFTYALSLVTIFTIFSDIGLTNILTRELTKRTEEKKEYLSTALVVKLFFLFVTLILISLCAPLISKFDAAKPLMIILAVTITFDSLRSFFYAITRSENRMEAEAGLGIVTEIFITTFILLTFFKSPSIEALAWAYMIGNGIGLMLTILYLRQYVKNVFYYFKKQLVRPLIRTSWPFAVMGIFGMFMTNIDSVIIAIFNNPHELGLYAAAQRPISLLYILPGFLSIALFPIINKFSGNRDPKNLSILIQKTTLMSLAIALPIVVGGIIVAGPLINITFGYQFIGAVVTFQILLVSLLAVFPGAIFADLILAEDKQRVFIRSSFLGAATNVILDLLLIPTYGIAGSAIATVAAQLVVNSIFFREIKKTVDFKIARDLKKMVLATIIMSILVYILKTLAVPLLLILVTSIAIYLGLLYIMKEQIIQDIKETFLSLS